MKIAFALLVVLWLAACSPSALPNPLSSEPPAAGIVVPTPAVTPERGTARSPRQARIVEPATTGWPRRVEDVSGVVTLAAKPMRIHTLSVGYDEITFQLVDHARVIAVGRSTVNLELSNVAAVAAQIPNQVGRNAEEVVALHPDLVVASPFSSPDLVLLLRRANIPLVVADLVSSADAHEENIRFLAYLYGEEERGETLIRDVRARTDRLQRLVGAQPLSARPRVLMMLGSSTAGSGTNEDGILQLAGGRNAAAEAGLVGNRPISLEVIPGMDPDYIVFAEPDPTRPTLGLPVLQHPAVRELRAVRENRVLRIKGSLLSTLSHWNVAAAEELARTLYPTAGI